MIDDKTSISNQYTNGLNRKHIVNFTLDYSNQQTVGALNIKVSNYLTTLSPTPRLHVTPNL